LVASAAHVFVDDLANPGLADDDRHHLSRVLRLRDGELVTVSDGVGSWRVCRFTQTGELEPSGETRVEPRQLPEITIGFGIPKGDRPEWIVQKLTEIGADRIVPLHTERGVVRWDAARGARHLERLRKISREAACQSRRTWLPVVEPVTDVVQLIGTPGVAIAAMGGSEPSLAASTILIGPEGGWTEREIAGSAVCVGLGTTVMRVETSALVACALLVQLRPR
jgi:16S rRNA (uracil1498-N3)-methyltransferase